MKRLRHLTKQNGQALVELAMFGTVLLFCLSLLTSYGMSTIYNQNMKMRSFRKAFVRASANDTNSPRRGHVRFDPGWDYEHPDPGEPALPGNHWRQVSYVVLEDKPTVSVSGILPLSGRTSVAMGASALRSIDMFANKDFPDDPNDPDDPAQKDLPRTEYEINDRRYSFTTAAYREYSEAELGELRQKADIPDWDRTGPFWQWKIVTLDEIEAPTSVDVDGDGHEEYVLEVIMASPGPPAVPASLKVIDYQEGEFDSGVEEVGIEDDYIERKLVTNSTFTRQENIPDPEHPEWASAIVTIDDIDTQDIFERTIKLKEEEYYDVEDNLATKRKATWYTPH